jgi:hypothetical protein
MDSYLRLYYQSAKEKPISISGGVSLFLSIIASFNFFFRWIEEDIMNTILLIIPVVAFFVILLIYTPYAIYKKQRLLNDELKQEKQKLEKDLEIAAKQVVAPPDALISSTLQNMNIRIGDLAREDFVIRKKVFDNCHIYGPAIIAIRDSTFTHNIFKEVVPSGALIETSNEIISGAILLEDCVVRDCTLHKIGIIGSPETIKKIRGGFVNKPSNSQSPHTPKYGH